MASKISVSDIYKALSQIPHPEHEDHNLVELEIIGPVHVEDRQILIEVAFPFPNLPVKDQILDSVHTALAGLDTGLNVQIATVQMTPEQRADFMVRLRGEEPAAHRRHIEQVIAVMSGKGGVGKSSVAGLLAATLQRQGARVGVLDADITGPSIPKMFGVTGSPATGPDGMMPVLSQTGIRLMSINLLLQDEGQPVVWRGPLIGRAIEQFWRDVAWGELDYLIIDLPPGTSDAALTVAQLLPVNGIVLVTSPQDLAGMVVQKAARMATQLGIPLIGLVENMSYVVCPGCGAVINVFGPSRAAETARLIGSELLGHIALDPELAVRCDNGATEDYRCAAFDGIVEQIFAAMPVELPSIPLYGS